MARGYHPPPPRQQQQSKFSTIDSLFTHDTGDDTMANSSLNDIDDSDDDVTEISDNDSILAMARRMDASSVISDPSFIEGPRPHAAGVEPGGLGGGRGGGGRGRGPGGLYARDRDLDSIASESESSSSGSSSDSSAERNPRRGGRGNDRGGGRPVGQPRVGFHDGPPRRPNGRAGRGGGGRRPAPAGPYYRDQGPPEPNPNRGRQFRSAPPGGTYAPGPPELNPNRGRQGPYGPDPGPPELNMNRGVRFAEKGQRRVYNPYEGPGGPPQQQQQQQQQHHPPPRGRSRSRSPGAASRGSRGSKDSRKSAKEKENEKRERRRRLKLICIPIAVAIAIAIAVAIAVVVGKQGGKDDSSMNEPVYEVPALPTAAPIYEGLYNCPVGRSGHFPIKGCLGYVYCNSMGEAAGNVIQCPKGTLYDVRNNVCNHVDNVQCSTKLPDLDELASINNPPPTPKPTNRPTPRPTPRPITPSYETIESPTPEYDIVSELRGPTPTYNHRLAFVGVSSPGDVTSFQQSLENYINIFYGPAELAKLEEGNPYKSLSDVTIEVEVTGMSNRRHLSGAAAGADDANLANVPMQPNERGVRPADASEDANAPTQSNIRGKPGRGLQAFPALGESGGPPGAGEPAGDPPRFVATYNQVTTYRTSDPSITVGMVVRYPFDEQNSAMLVEHLRRRDPNTFYGLTDIVFLEGDQAATPETAPPVSSPVSAAPTPRPTRRPTNPRTPRPTNPRATEPPPEPTGEPTPFEQETRRPTPRPTPDPTERPSPSPTSSPTPKPIFIIMFPTLMNIQGLVWLDEDRNGLFDPLEKPMEGLFVNLRACRNDKWKATVTTNDRGQYQFVGVAEGEYYVEFFKPMPATRYEFTIPALGGNDDDTLDSDVVHLDEDSGKSKCMAVGKGFDRLTNAGYVYVEEPATPGPSPPPTPPPTAAATPAPSTSRPTTAAPVRPRYCAEVTTLEGGNKAFDFRECSLPCVAQHEDCPDGMLCALTNDC